MKSGANIRRTVLLAAALGIVPDVQAEDAVKLPLFDGALVLTADAGLRQDIREADGALIDFWRPVTFGPAEKPIGGRMDCKLGGVRQDNTDALFDIRRRYRDSREDRERSGLDDEDSDYGESGAGEGAIRRLEITGHAGNPHRHYVLTYLVMRDGPNLYDIRLNCEFRHLHNPGQRTDYAAIMRRYVDIAVPLPTRQSPDS